MLGIGCLAPSLSGSSSPAKPVPHDVVSLMEVSYYHLSSLYETSIIIIDYTTLRLDARERRELALKPHQDRKAAVSHSSIECYRNNHTGRMMMNYECQYHSTTHTAQWNQVESSDLSSTQSVHGSYSIVTTALQLASVREYADIHQSMMQSIDGEALARNANDDHLSS
jgi:hypothetical protein